MEETNLQKIYEQHMQAFRDIKGCAFKAYNFYKAGMTEDIYEEGLKWELEHMGYKVWQQQEFHISYKGNVLNKTKRMDLVVTDEYLGNIVLELKALNAVDDKQRSQLFSYLRLMNWKYGLLFNFSPSSVYSEIWEYDSIANKFKRFII